MYLWQLFHLLHHLKHNQRVTVALLSKVLGRLEAHGVLTLSLRVGVSVVSVFGIVIMVLGRYLVFGYLDP